jgi:hypothetical protein
VAEETVKNWTRAGLLPPRVHIPPTGFLTHKAQFFWRGSDLREWRERMIGVIFKRPPKPRGRRAEWVQGQGWVELAPPVDPVVRDTARAKPRRRSAKIPGQHIMMLTRLCGQLADLSPEAPHTVVERSPPPRRPEPEPIPFASNEGKSRARPARYW